MSWPESSHRPPVLLVNMPSLSSFCYARDDLNNTAGRREYGLKPSPSACKDTPPV